MLDLLGNIDVRLLRLLFDVLLKRFPVDFEVRLDAVPVPKTATHPT